MHKALILASVGSSPTGVTKGRWQSGLMRRSAKPLFAGSNPARPSNYGDYMLLEILASAFLWSGMDHLDRAQLAVINCNKVELHYGGQPTANKRRVDFWFKDLRYGHTYLYSVPMYVGVRGQILLEPAKYWIEEIRQQPNILLRVENQEYIFDLSGTHKQIQCNGDVAQ